MAERMNQAEWIRLPTEVRRTIGSLAREARRLGITTVPKMARELARSRAALTLARLGITKGMSCFVLQEADGTISIGEGRRLNVRMEERNPAVVNIWNAYEVAVWGKDIRSFRSPFATVAVLADDVDRAILATLEGRSDLAPGAATRFRGIKGNAYEAVSVVLNSRHGLQNAAFFLPIDPLTADDIARRLVEIAAEKAAQAAKDSERIVAAVEAARRERDAEELEWERAREARLARGRATRASKAAARGAARQRDESRRQDERSLAEPKGHMAELADGWMPDWVTVPT